MDSSLPFRAAPDLLSGCSGLQLCPELADTIHQLAESLGNAVDAKDHCTRCHSQEVAEVAQILALALGLSPAVARLVHVAGHLHDIGKIGLPDAILHKAGPLDPEEWALVRLHPVLGADIVRPVRGMNGPGGIAEIILHHHERLDGSGYPHGLAGDRIPLGARVIAVADSLSAMMQPRPYKGPRTFADALAEIARLSGVQYDPLVVEALLRQSERVRRHLTAERG
ncbi:MAG: HD domain-containing protein [Desulfarculus sp.]|nr:HD domain-containing protein [Desulfarculus sp.]